MICPRCKDAACEAVRQAPIPSYQSVDAAAAAIAAIRALPEPPAPSEEEIVERMVEAQRLARWDAEQQSRNAAMPWTVEAVEKYVARAALAVVREMEAR